MEVLERALELVAAEGRQGLPLPKLWVKLSHNFPSLEATERQLVVDVHIKRWTANQLIASPHVSVWKEAEGSFVELTEHGACADDQLDNEKIVPVAATSVCQQYLGIESASKSLTETQMRILEEIGRGGSRGVIQTAVGARVGIQPRDMHYHIKHLERQLIVRTKVFVSGSVTHQLHLKRFAPSSSAHSEVSNEVKRENVSTDGSQIDIVDDEPLLKKISDMLEKAPEKSMTVVEIRERCQMPRKKPKSPFERLRRRLLNAKCIEEFSALESQRFKTALCWKLINPWDSCAADEAKNSNDKGSDLLQQFKAKLPDALRNGPTVERSLARQIYDMLKLAGKDGLFSTDICQLLCITMRNCHNMLDVLIAEGKISKVAETVHKVTAFRYTVKDVEEGGNLNQPMSEPSTHQTAPTKPSRRNFQTTVQNRERRDFVIDFLERHRMVLLFEITDAIKKAEKAKDPEKTSEVDRKSVERLVDRLHADRLVKAMTVSIPRMDGVHKQHRIVIHKDLDPGDDAVREYIAQLDFKISGYRATKAKAERLKVTETIVEAASGAAYTRQHQKARHTIVCSNGFCPPKMERAKLLHHHLWSIIPQQGQYQFTPSEVVNTMTVSKILQIVGYEESLLTTEEVVPFESRICDVPAELKKRLVDSNHRIQGQMKRLLFILRKLRLVGIASEGSGTGEDGAVASIYSYRLEEKGDLEGIDCLRHGHHQMASYDFSKAENVEKYWRALEDICTWSQDGGMATDEDIKISEFVRSITNPRHWALGERDLSTVQTTEVFKFITMTRDRRALYLGVTEAELAGPPVHPVPISVPVPIPMSAPVRIPIETPPEEVVVAKVIALPEDQENVAPPDGALNRLNLEEKQLLCRKLGCSVRSLNKYLKNVNFDKLNNEWSVPKVIDGLIGPRRRKRKIRFDPSLTKKRKRAVAPRSDEDEPQTDIDALMVDDDQQQQYQLNPVRNRKWERADDIALIYHFVKSGASDVSDWSDLSASVSDGRFSPQQCRHRLQTLKRKSFQRSLTLDTLQAWVNESELEPLTDEQTNQFAAFWNLTISAEEIEIYPKLERRFVPTGALEALMAILLTPNDDYNADVGKMLLSQFSEEDVNTAMRFMHGFGWVVKPKSTPHLRGYNVSHKFHAMLSKMAQPALIAYTEDPGKLMVVDGEEISEDVGTGKLLSILREFAKGHIKLSAGDAAPDTAHPEAKLRSVKVESVPGAPKTTPQGSVWDDFCTQTQLRGSSVRSWEWKELLSAVEQADRVTASTLGQTLEEKGVSVPNLGATLELLVSCGVLNRNGDGMFELNSSTVWSSQLHLALNDVMPWMVLNPLAEKLGESGRMALKIDQDQVQYFKYAILGFLLKNPGAAADSAASHLPVLTQGQALNILDLLELEGKVKHEVTHVHHPRNIWDDWNESNESTEERLLFFPTMDFFQKG